MMKSRAFHFAALGLLTGSTILGACGGSTPPPEAAAADGERPGEPPSEDGAGDSGEAPSGSIKFDEMSAPEKMQHMKKVVMPEMAKVFQAFDAEEYDDFGCSDCHGTGAKAGNFSMPSPDLPALDKEEMDEHPEITKMMMEQVVPKMAELLGEQPYNPETHEGFGCYDCHTKKE